MGGVGEIVERLLEAPPHLEKLGKRLGARPSLLSLLKVCSLDDKLQPLFAQVLWYIGSSLQEEFLRASRGSSSRVVRSEPCGLHAPQYGALQGLGAPHTGDRQSVGLWPREWSAIHDVCVAGHQPCGRGRAAGRSDVPSSRSGLASGAETPASIAVNTKSTPGSHQVIGFFGFKRNFAIR